MLILSYILGAVFIFLCLVGVVSFLWMIFFSARMMFQFSIRRDAFSQRTLWNPMNAIINPSVLNENGLISRRRVLRGGLVFVLSFAAAGCAAAIFSFAFG